MSMIAQFFYKLMWVKRERYKSLGVVKLGDTKTVFNDYYFLVLG